ncbi:galactokinase Gal1 [Schizosaccharomyces japonicus yFS275]|uniref:Galactokinase n=1 Tax=Schizosaccharomyces japonicus (strain yFS275 / FY16936) TaxID=402676 RepID=B6K2X6_SCHJY|nr:galactokinase Gal1 [Schizosaccharomyces japonicus yFS275]EEB07833.2 galactokinase Gal1 [Schizosaccharomyces japonicus yFS275]
MAIMVPVVPTFQDLSFYSDPTGNQPRYESALRLFEKSFHEKPAFFSRSPGRVNIVGEHIDYNYFSVLPMALEVDVIIAAATATDNKVILTNTDPKFQQEEFELPIDGSVITINKEHHSWGNYFRCALIVAHHFIKEKYGNLIDNGKKPLKGLRLTFDGNVPTGGGLSSSAAFCVASIVTILKANGIKSISKDDLTHISVVSEHYVGVNTGGMDQCASIYGEPNKLLLIQFRPKLIGIPFQIPSTNPKMVFLVTNTLFQANKHETAPKNYNLRVVEMAIASELFAKKYSLNTPKDSNLKGAGTLRGVMDAYFEQILRQPAWDGNDLKIGIGRMKEMLNLAEELFTSEEKKGFTTVQVAKRFGMSVGAFTKTFLTQIPVRFEVLKLYQRTVHVYSDAMRVLEVLQLFREHQPTDPSIAFLTEFGKILNESQVSNELYNNSSSPELKEVCAISTAYGAYGARTTGAGWGGSAVHLCTVDKLPEIVAALTEQYYKKHFPRITQKELDSAIVVSKPGIGTCVVEYNENIISGRKM